MHYATTSTLILALLSASATAIPFSSFVIPTFLPEKVGNELVTLSGSAFHLTTVVAGPTGTGTFTLTGIVPVNVPVTKLSGVTFPTGVPTGWTTGTGKNESTSFEKPTITKPSSTAKETGTTKASFTTVKPKSSTSIKASSTLKESTTSIKKSSASSSTTHVPRGLIDELQLSKVIETKVVDGKTVSLSIPVLVLPTGTGSLHWKPTGTEHHFLPTGTGVHHHHTESKKPETTHESKKPEATSKAVFTTKIE